MLEEAKENYKEMSFKQRALIMVLVGLLPTIYIYYDEGSSLSEKLQTAQQTKITESKKYQVAKNKQEKLPLLEEKLTKVTEQLRRAQEKLPNKIYMDDILHSTANIAKDAGIKFNLFKPGAETAKQGAHQYMEMSIALAFTAQYSQVMTFFDNIANMEKIIHLRNINMTAERDNNDTSSVLINTKAELIVFRSS